MEDEVKKEEAEDKAEWSKVQDKEKKCSLQFLR